MRTRAADLLVLHSLEVPSNAGALNVRARKRGGYLTLHRLPDRPQTPLKGPGKKELG